MTVPWVLIPFHASVSDDRIAMDAGRADFSADAQKAQEICVLPVFSLHMKGNTPSSRRQGICIAYLTPAAGARGMRETGSRTGSPVAVRPSVRRIGR
jgi:hypothetical protein